MLVVDLRFRAWLAVETAPRAFHHEIMPCGVVRRSRGCSNPQIDAISFPFGLEVVRAARPGEDIQGDYGLAVNVLDADVHRHLRGAAIRDRIRDGVHLLEDLFPRHPDDRPVVCDPEEDAPALAVRERDDGLQILGPVLVRHELELERIGKIGACPHRVPAAIGRARHASILNRRMIFPQIGDMCGPPFFPDGLLPFQNGIRHFRHLRHLDERLTERTDVVRRTPRIDYAFRHVRLEGAIAGEHHDAVEIRLVNAEVVRNRADVPVVLPYRILEPALLSVDRLRPLGAPLIAEYPARISLRLDDEDAVLRHDNMVDLGGGPIGKRQLDIIQHQVLVRKPLAQASRDKLLPARTFLLRAAPPQPKHLERDHDG